MAAVFDAVSTAAAATGTSRTWSHTCGPTGTDGLLLVFVWVDSATDIVTAKTYNGVTPAQTIVSTQGGSAKAIYLFRFQAPASGAHDVVITVSASVSIAGCAISLTGAAQGNLSVVAGLATSSATDLVGSIDTIVNDSFVAMFAENDLEAPTAGANNTARTLTEKRAACTQWTNLVATPAQVYPKLSTTALAAWQGWAFAVAPFGSGGGGGGTSARALRSSRQRRAA